MSLTVGIINGKAKDGGGAGGVSDADLSAVVIDFLNPGALSADHFKLTEPAGTSKTVVVKAGTYYAPNAAGTMVYKVTLSEDTPVTVPDNPNANPRIDAIVLKIDLGETPDSTASNVASLIEVEGTPAASPTAPDDATIQSEAGSGNVAVRLGNVTAASGFTTITDADLEDTRTFAQISKEVLEQLGTEQYGDGTVTTDKIDDEAVTEAKQVVKSSYSTSEIDTGATWIDGKAIYKKTIDMGAFPNSTGKNVAHGITGLDTLVKHEVIFNNGGTKVMAPYYSNSGSAARVGVGVTTTNVTVYTTFDASTYTGHATLYYTKT